MVQQTDAKGKAEVSYNFEADIIHYNLNDHSNRLYKKLQINLYLLWGNNQTANVKAAPR